MKIDIIKTENDYLEIVDNYSSLNCNNPDYELANHLSFASVQCMHELIEIQFALSKEDLKQINKTLTEAREYYYRKIKVMELIHQHSKQKYIEINTEINRKSL